VRDVLLKNTPTKRFAQTDEIGALTAFLCSPNATSITGTSFWDFLLDLKEVGRSHADVWLKENFDSIGRRSTVDINKAYL
jgi:hypothetical protein